MHQTRLRNISQHPTTTTTTTTTFLAVKYLHARVTGTIDSKLSCNRVSFVFPSFLVPLPLLLPLFFSLFLPLLSSSIPLSPPLAAVPSRFSMDLHKSTKASNTLYRQEYLIRPREPSPSSLIQNTLMVFLSLFLSSLENPSIPE